MRVRLLINLNHRGEVLSAGSVVALPAELAALLIAGGSAELVEVPEQAMTSPEQEQEPDQELGQEQEADAEPEPEQQAEPESEQQAEPEPKPKAKGKAKKEG